MTTSSDLTYFEIIDCIKEDFLFLDKNLYKIFDENKTFLSFYFNADFFQKSKKIRSAIIFLLSRAIWGKVTERTYNIAMGIELLHNASLVHDDIIDDADKRRDKNTLNFSFGDKLAVIAGDFLFALAFRVLLAENTSGEMDNYVKTFKLLCEGEIEQYFNKNKLTGIDEYIQKSENKTATLFCVGVENAFSKELSGDRVSRLIEFARNFGIAFQIKNDLNNIIVNKGNNVSEDIKNGIYTAPVIFACEENSQLLEKENCINELMKTNCIKRTNELISVYLKKAVDNLFWIKDNIYKEKLFLICKNMGDIN